MTGWDPSGGTGFWVPGGWNQLSAWHPAPIPAADWDRLTLGRPVYPGDVNQLLIPTGPVQPPQGGDQLLRPGSGGNTFTTGQKVATGGIIAVAFTFVVFLPFMALCCFDADTPVVMADGSTKPIQDVHPGDWVIAYDEQTHRTVSTHVQHATTIETKGAMTLYFGGGEQINTTENHLFYVPGKGFVPARNIAPQTVCRLSAGASLKVVKIAWEM